MKIDNQVILNILSKVLNLQENVINTIQDTDDLSGHGLGSLRSIDLVVSLEGEFNIVLDGDDLLLENINTLKKIRDLVEKRMNQGI